LNLSATLLNKVKEQQVREVLQFIVTRACAQVQDLGHRRSSSSIIKSAPFIAESTLFHNAPKGGGDRLYKKVLPAPVTSARTQLHLHYKGLQVIGCSQNAETLLYRGNSA